MSREGDMGEPGRMTHGSSWREERKEGNDIII